MSQVWTLATGRCSSTSTAAATRLVSLTALMAGRKCWHLLLELFVFVFVFECCLRKLLYRLPAMPALCSCLFALLDIFSNFVSNFESVLRKLADSGSPWEIGKGNNFSLDLYTISSATGIFASNFGALLILSKEKPKRWKQAEYIDEEAIINDNGKGERRPKNAIRCTRACASM